MDIFGAPSATELAQLAIRLVATYFLLLGVARFLGRRVPAPGNRDLMVAAMLGGLVAPALLRDQDAPATAIAGIILLFSINTLVSRLTFRFPSVERRLLGPRRVLVADGRINRKELLREGIVLSELNAIVRGQGVQSLGAIERLSLEPDGVISVSARDKSEQILTDILSALQRLERRLPPTVSG
jgi:uncharacterized membrane protein YcaP (DUF421 family)